MHIETARFDTELEARAYVSGIHTLSDMVLDFAGFSVRTTEPELIQGKYVVSVDDARDEEDEGEEWEQLAAE